MSTVDPWTALARQHRTTATTYRRRRLALLAIVSAILMLVVAVEDGAIDRSSVDTPAVSQDPLSDG